MTEYLARNNRVDSRALRNIYSLAKAYWLKISEAFVKFLRALEVHGNTIIAKMEEADKNRDGVITISGFEASLLYKYNEMNS